MRLACEVGGQPAMIVGYVSAKRGIHAIVILGGELRHVGLKKIKLLNIPEELAAPKVVPLKKGKA